MSIDMETSSVYFSSLYSRANNFHASHQSQQPQQPQPTHATMSAQLTIRNKYNTMTAAEAKKFTNNRLSLNYNGQQRPAHNFDSLSTSSTLSRRPPIRTASVMHKPRPPPLVVTDLDSDELDSDFGLSAGSSTTTTNGRGNASNSISHDNKLKSSSKTSLSSATYKVFQQPYANFKRFMRNMPRLPFSSSSPVPASTSPGKPRTLDNYCTTGRQAQTKPKQHLSSDSHQSLEESISQLCFNRSQSPPACPPPLGELKSMSYMEDSVNYSNYDDFTRSRNEQLNTWHGPRSGGPASRRPTCLNLTPNKANFDVYSINSSNNQAHNNSISLDSSASDSSWQLASLPVTYERNLTSVCEESKQQQQQQVAHRDNTSVALSDQTVRLDDTYATAIGYDVVDCNDTDRAKSQTPDQRTSELIKPPLEFDDSFERQKRLDEASLPASNQASLSSSSRSLASTTTADSVLDYHRQTATKFRFSFAQAPQTVNSGSNNNNNIKNAGLPPRMPSSTSHDVVTSVDPEPAQDPQPSISTPEAGRSVGLKPLDPVGETKFANYGPQERMFMLMCIGAARERVKPSPNGLHILTQSQYDAFLDILDDLGPKLGVRPRKPSLSAVRRMWKQYLDKLTVLKPERPRGMPHGPWGWAPKYAYTPNGGIWFSDPFAHEET